MIINGEKVNLSELASPDFKALFDFAGVNAGRVAVERNGEIVRKADYEQIQLSDDDVIEIIHFVGGGSR